MFDNKLQPTVTKPTTSGSAFVAAGLKKSAETRSENGALKYKTTGNPFVDQFGKVGTYKKPRVYNDITADCEILYGTDKRNSILFIFYIRMITRIVTLFSGISTNISQKGAEMKHEGIMRMMWLHFKEPEIFWKNIHLFVAVGSWKDIFVMLQYDLTYHGWDKRKLDWDKMGRFILAGLNNEQAVNLVKKYLPQIKANSQCTTIEAQADNQISKWICSLLYGTKTSPAATYKQYRKLKTSGTAHQWQQLISQGKHDLVEFDKIHGRALSLLVKSKYLFNQGLSDKYATWITAPETKEVKYTGFVHELFESCTKYRNISEMKSTEIPTITKQFNTLIQKGGASEQSSLIVVRDTSGSMSYNATGTTMSCGNVAKSLALYFSSFLKGHFTDAWIEFNSAAKMHTWVGTNVVEKWFNDKANFFGSTDFMSVIELFVRLKQTGVAEEDFPKGILCISDGEFNPVSLNKTNVETALLTLARAGFSQEYADNFVIVLWNLQSNGRGDKFETNGAVPNIYYFSGYSASVISFLTGKIKNAEELFQEAMSQEILQMIEM